MRIDIITLFPKMFKGPFGESIVKRAEDKSLVEIKIHNLRKWGIGRHKQVDDRPFGGGTGMILRIDIIANALEKIKNHACRQAGQKSKIKMTNQNSKTILLSPSGTTFDQQKAMELSKFDHLVLICGHYEGVDQRVSDNLIDEEISIGDYVLTGGELPAMVLIDSVIRLIPGVLEKPDATINESFSSTSPLKIENSKIENLLEHPQYTRPADYKGWKVPEVLISGDHKKIEKWKMEKSLEKTKKIRPDLLP